MTSYCFIQKVICVCLFQFTSLYQQYEYIKKFYRNIDESGRRYTETFAGDSRVSRKRRFYLDNNKGIKTCSLWTDREVRITSSSKERTGYPTQKPVALYARMIKASSNQHDVVLDPFAGSGTTLDAAQSLGRRWIGIDIGDDAIKTIESRLRDRHGMLLDYEIHRTEPKP